VSTKVGEIGRRTHERPGESAPPRDVFVHEFGLCESANVGSGTRVWAFSHVLDGAIIGQDCNLGDGSFVEGGAVLRDRVVVKNGVSVWAGVTLEDDVFAGPNVAFTNDHVPRAAPYRTPVDGWLPTLVRTGATLGANATILCGVTIGRHALVAAGSVVTRDVPAHAIVRGSPARQAGWICLCGGRVDGELRCDQCGREYRKESDGLHVESDG
jgi:UDP-2-acetamido-3-amino-2,3-dideoxy-glucuronate N-acetyltransferase